MIFCDVLRLLKKTLGFELPLALPAFYHWRLASHSSGGTKRFRYQARAPIFSCKNVQSGDQESSIGILALVHSSISICSDSQGWLQLSDWASLFWPEKPSWIWAQTF